MTEPVCCVGAQWEFEDDQGIFKDTYDWLSEQSEEAYQARRFEFTIHSGDDWSWDYDLRDMTQRGYWGTWPMALHNLRRTIREEFSTAVSYYIALR